MQFPAFNQEDINRAMVHLHARADALDPATSSTDPAAQHAAFLALQEAIAAVQALQKPLPKAEGILQQGEDGFRLLVTAVEDYAIFMLDAHGTILSWNHGAQRIKGYTAEEIIGQHFALFYPADQIAAGKPMTLLAIAAQWGHYTEEGWRVRKDGTRFWASVTITALHDVSGVVCGFGKVTRDLTERKVAEEALRQSEERFRLLIESVYDYAIFMLDPYGRITSWNTGAQQIKGYTATEILGEHFSCFYHPDEVVAGKPDWELTVAQQEGHYEEEGWRRRKDGTRFWASVVITPIRDATGALRGYAKVTRDLTERKRADAEREHLRQQAMELELERERRTQMEAAVSIRDTFLAVAAHELKTPLTTILGSAEIQARRLSRTPQVPAAEQQRAALIVRQAQRLQRLVNGLLDITRLHQNHFRLEYIIIDLSALIQQVVDDLQLLYERHTLMFHLPAAPVMLMIDYERMEQVLYNLLQNAVKYSPNGGTVDVTLASTDQEITISITDQGLGIDPTDLPHIFEQFYRSSAPDPARQPGIGVGLYVAQAIVEHHGGRIEVTSTVGQGSCFTVILPASLIDAHDSNAAPRQEHIHEPG